MEKERETVKNMIIDLVWCVDQGIVR